MILYDLQCHHGHEFEGWFPNSESFERQAAAGLVACAICGSTEVIRLPTGGHLALRATPAVPMAPSKSAPEQGEPTVNVDPVTLMKAVQQFVKTNCKHVGTDFTKKAIDMHEGKAEQEPIYGNATPEQREELEDAGVLYTPLPELPEEFNN